MTDPLRLWLSAHEPLAGDLMISTTGEGAFRVDLDARLLASYPSAVLTALLTRASHAGVELLGIRIEHRSGTHHEAGDFLGSAGLLSVTAHLARTAVMLPRPLRAAELHLTAPSHVAADCDELAAALGARVIAKRIRLDLERLEHWLPSAIGDSHSGAAGADCLGDALDGQLLDFGRRLAPKEPQHLETTPRRRLHPVLGPEARRCVAGLPEWDLAMLLSRLPRGPAVEEALAEMGRGLELRASLLACRFGDLARVRAYTAATVQAAFSELEQALEAVTSTEAGAVLPDGNLLACFPNVERHANTLTSGDPRLSAFLWPHPDVRRMSANCNSLRTSELLRRLTTLEARIAAWGQMTLEQTAADLLVHALPDRADLAPLLARRYGADGLGVTTLDELGRQLGVTRERVRQLQGKAEQRIAAMELANPPLDQASQVLEMSLPCTSMRLAESLRQGGLTSLGEWRADALKALASRFGRHLEVAQLDDLVLWERDLPVAKAALSTARRLSGFQGVVSLRAIATELADAEAVDDAENTVREVLSAASGIHWLDDDLLWTDHPVGRNRLVNTCLRMVTVISPQTIDDLHEGVERNFSWRASTGGGRFAGLRAPEPRVLQAFLEQHPAFEVLPDGLVHATDSLPMESLGPEKLAMVGVLLAEPGHLMHRNELMAGCLEAGMNISTATVFTSYAEVLKRFGPNVWGLRGVHPTKEAIESVQEKARTDRSLVDARRLSGRTASGRPWTARVITPTFRFSGVLPSEWALPDLLDRTLRAVDLSDGEDAGQLRFSVSFNYGYTVLLGKHRPDIGDVIRVVADPEEDCAMVEFGGEELLDEPFDW